MRRVLVTGATGFLGEHVVRHLLAHGLAKPDAADAADDPGTAAVHVRALARGHSPVLDELTREPTASPESPKSGDAGRGTLEIIRGDLLEGDALAPAITAALADCDGVFHLAGLVSRNPDDSQKMMRIHVDGTRRVLEAAAAARVARVVVASTSGTVAVSDRDEVKAEDAGYATEIVAGWPYYASKVYQEKLAFELGEKLGVETVAVNPSLLLGPGDRRISSTTDVLRFLRRQIPVVPDGGMNFVDVRDAAAATVAAMTRGRPGERYLVGGPNWTVKEFFGRLERVSKVRAPVMGLSGGLSRMSAGIIEHLYRARGKEPPVDRMSVEMGQHFWYLDASKARRELGFEPRDPTLTLVDTVRYLRRDLAAAD